MIGIFRNKRKNKKETFKTQQFVEYIKDFIDAPNKIKLTIDKNSLGCF